MLCWVLWIILMIIKPEEGGLRHFWFIAHGTQIWVVPRSHKCPLKWGQTCGTGPLNLWSLMLTLESQCQNGTELWLPGWCHSSDCWSGKTPLHVKSCCQKTLTAGPLSSLTLNHSFHPLQNFFHFTKTDSSTLIICCQPPVFMSSLPRLHSTDHCYHHCPGKLCNTGLLSASTRVV